MKGLLEAVRDHLVNIKARAIEHVMKSDKPLPSDVRADLVIILGRANVAIRIIDTILSSLERVKK
jgi:hypothetical protein